MTVHSSHSGGDTEIRAAKAGSAGRQFYEEQHPAWITDGEEVDCSPRALPGRRLWDTTLHNTAGSAPCVLAGL